MPQIVVDFRNVPKVDPVPEGQYIGVCETVVHKESQTSGKPYLDWEWRIVDGDQTGRTVRLRTSLQDQSLWLLQSCLEALIPDGEALEEFAFDIRPNGYVTNKEIIGAVAVLHVVHEATNTGRTRSIVQYLDQVTDPNFSAKSLKPNLSTSGKPPVQPQLDLASTQTAQPAQLAPKLTAPRLKLS